MSERRCDWVVWRGEAAVKGRGCESGEGMRERSLEGGEGVRERSREGGEGVREMELGNFIDEGEVRLQGESEEESRVDVGKEKRVEKKKREV